MNCRKSIFKFLGIAAVCAASAACSVDDADDLALVKLGALKKEFVVEADANTFDIDIYANSAFHIERINQADWISLTCGETEDGKGAITAECEFNEGFKRKAGFVLCSDVDARRDTVYVKQKARVDAKIEFANSYLIFAGAGGAAHLPGMVASMTTLPVVGVPVKSRALNGLDSLLSIVQMPAGVPVATTAINGAKNAALIAVSILALQDAALAAKLDAFRAKQTADVLKAEI